MATVSACCSFGTLGGLEVNYGLRSPMPLRKLFILYLNISSIALNLYFISMHCGHAVLLFFMGMFQQVPIAAIGPLLPYEMNRR